MGTVREDGTASVVPCWYRYSDGRIYMTMDRDARRLTTLRRDPRVSITVIVATTRPYAHVWLGGRAIEFNDDADHSNLRSLYQIYYGEPPAPGRTDIPVAVVIDTSARTATGWSVPREIRANPPTASGNSLVQFLRERRPPAPKAAVKPDE
jgi:nitroimidazol reductase NimA-like FMN-containing flavoprotein (pyridoxamine 5'-phosphate oxidase superfamily)